MSTVDPTATAAPPRPAPRPRRRGVTLDTRRPAGSEAQRVGEICPTCCMATSLTGTCDTCD